MPLEAADKTIICSAGQSSPRIGRCWSLVRYSLMGFICYESGWLTLGAKWYTFGPEVELRNFTLIVTWVYNVDIKPVLIYKGADSTDLAISCILGMSVFPSFLLFHPYVSMGIGAQMGQLPAKWTMSSLLTMIIGRYKHQHLSHFVQ